MSGVIKGIGHAIKKVVKGVAHFVKKYWKVIVIAAAIVFTCGIATVGLAGFSAASAAAGGGFGGFMSAVGSTMVAGVASIGGSIGIGSGVTASTAGGAFAAAPVMAGVSSGAGLTLGTGAAAQGLGLAASTYAPAATAANAGVAGAAGAAGGATTGSGGGLLSTTSAYTGPGAISADGSLGSTLGGQMTAADVAGGAGGAGAAGAASVGTSQIAPVSDIAYSGSAPTAATQSPGLLGTILNSKAAGPLIYGGMQAIQGYAQGKAMEDQYDQEKPLSYWGVGARGDANGGGAVNSIFGPSETLTGPGASPFTPAPTSGQQPLQQISQYVPDARANLPNGVQWMPNLPNARQGLMALGWDVNTGKPIYANDPTLQYAGG